MGTFLFILFFFVLFFIFKKGNNLCDSLFGSLDDESIPEMESTLKRKNLNFIQEGYDIFQERVTF